jgi:hypothetical protein
MMARSMRRFTRLVGLACLATLLALPFAAEPFWGARASEPVDTDPSALEQGQFIWEGDAVPSGPLLVVVSLLEQRAYVYRNGVRIGITTVSTGKPGHRTPTGIFTVLQKDAHHHSKTYNDAPMPYAERLTWDGVALHAGGLPGYPSSHGCVHLPSEFARQLFAISSLGMTVVIADEGKAPEAVVHPAAIAPVDVATGTGSELPRLGAQEIDRWQPELSPEGPVTILVSGADLRALVFRNGKEIGRTKLALRDPGKPLGTHAFTVIEGKMESTNPSVSSAPTPRWIALGIPGHAGDRGLPLDPAQVARVTLPPEFVRDVNAILAPGSTLLVTGAPVLEQQTTGGAMNILNADAPKLD